MAPTSFEAAVAWTGTESTLIVFAVGDTADVSVPEHLTQPDALSVYPLDQDEGADPAWSPCREYDVTYDRLPSDVAAVVHGLLSSAVANGARLAWAAFEGSFAFDHLLTPDVASQVYGLAYPDGVEVAVDDAVRASAGWADRVAVARARLAPA